MIDTNNQTIIDLKNLLSRCHDALWLNALEPIDQKEKLSQDKIEKLLKDIENFK